MNNVFSMFNLFNILNEKNIHFYDILTKNLNKINFNKAINDAKIKNNLYYEEKILKQYNHCFNFDVTNIVNINNTNVIINQCNSILSSINFIIDSIENFTNNKIIIVDNEVKSILINTLKDKNIVNLDGMKISQTKTFQIIVKFIKILHNEINIYDLISLLKLSNLNNDKIQEFEIDFLRINSSSLKNIAIIISKFDEKNVKKYREIYDILKQIVHFQINIKDDIFYLDTIVNFIKSLKIFQLNSNICQQILFFKIDKYQFKITQIFDYLMQLGDFVNVIKNINFDDNNVIFLCSLELFKYLENDTSLQFNNLIKILILTDNLLSNKAFNIYIDDYKIIKEQKLRDKDEINKQNINIVKNYNINQIKECKNNKLLDSFIGIKNGQELIQNKLFNEEEVPNIIKTEQKNIRLSPSAIQKLNINPYFWYIKYILKLKSIEPIQILPTSAEFGTIIHKIIDLFAENCKNINNENDIKLENFIILANQVFLSNLSCKINENNLLKNKVINIGKKIILIEKKAKQLNLNVISEKPLNLHFKNINLYAIPDRIEVDNANKTVKIYDFKSGNTLPSQNEEMNGLKTQLSIIAIILEVLYDYKTIEMSYISVSGEDLFLSSNIDEIFNENISNMMIENTKKNLKNIIKHYFDENILNSKNFTYIKCFKIYDNEIDYKRFKG